LAMARRCVAVWPALADKLAAAFWPGPLTLVLPRSPAIPDVVTAGGPTVGIRWPSHPFMQEVIRACGFPLAAPSANPSTKVSPTNAEHVCKSLGHRLSLVVDGGQSQIGIESTVLDLSVTPPCLLRPGMIHAESLVAVMRKSGLRLAPGGPAEPAAESGGFLRSPGQLRKHYAPRTKLVVCSWRDEADLQAQLAAFNVLPARVNLIAHTVIPFGETCGRVCVIPRDPEAIGRALYAELHRCDEEGAQLIVVEAVPESAEWAAIRDRLRRAAV